MIEKYTSIYTVLDKIRRDIGVEAEYRWTDVKEWVAELLQKVSTKKNMVLANCVIPVSNHRARIPCNVVRTIAVTYCGHRLRYGLDQRNLTSQRKFPIRGSYINGTTTDDIFEGDAWINKFYVREQILYDENGNILEERNVDTTQVILDAVPNSPVTEYYTIDGDWYKFSFETGTVEIDYIGVYLDEEGFPLIPDSTHLREAIYFYVAHKILGTQLLTMDNTTLQKWTLLKTMYEEQWVRAIAAINMPSADELRSFKADYIKLIPDLYRDDYYRQNGESRLNERTSSRQGLPSIYRGGI